MLNDKTVSIDCWLSALVRGTDVAGLSVCVRGNKGMIFNKAYGVHDKISGAPLQKDAIFPVASQTKTFTAVALLKLVLDSKISLEDKLVSYLPQFSHPLLEWPNIAARHRKADDYRDRLQYFLLSHYRVAMAQSNSSGSAQSSKASKRLSWALSNRARHVSANEPRMRSLSFVPRCKHRNKNRLWRTSRCFAPIQLTGPSQPCVPS